MADLAQNLIGQYSRSNIDKLYADSRESLFGHLVVERGRSVKAALEELRPHVKQALKSTEAAASWCQKLGISGVGLGVLVGASMGVGYAALPLLAGCLSLKFWADSRDEMPRREAEFHLLRECSNLPEALYALNLRGVNTAVLVGAYDALVSSVEARLERGAEFTEAEVGQFLEAKIKALGTIAPVTNQSQEGIQPIDGDQNNEGMTRAKGEAPGITGIQPIVIPQDATTAAAPSIVHSKVLCPIEVLGRDPYQSMGVIGGQRTGKTYTAALHTQNVKRNLKAIIIYINLMDANGDAADDWDHADIVITCHLRKLSPSKAKAVIERVTAVVNEFFNGLNQILVFDEWVGFTSKANQWPKKASQEAAAAAIESREAKTFIEPEGLGISAIELMNLVMAVTGELTQSGKKQAKAIWLLSPMVKAGAMEPQGLVIKEVAPMVVAISKDESVTWKHPVTGLDQEIGFDDAGYRASIPNMGLPPIESIPKLGCVRLLFAKGTWYSLDNLPKLEKSIKATPIAIPSPSSEVVPSETWESKQPIAVSEVAPIEPTKSHPLADRFDRLEGLLTGKETLPVREIQRALSCKSDEATQISQMFCLKSKAFKFVQTPNANGTISRVIERV